MKKVLRYAVGKLDQPAPADDIAKGKATLIPAQPWLIEKELALLRTKGQPFAQHEPVRPSLPSSTPRSKPRSSSTSATTNR